MAEKMDDMRLIRFSSSGRQYCFELALAKEVLRVVEFKHVQELPDFVRGLVNVRGAWLPVIDFAARAGEAIVSPDVHHRLILMRIKDVSLALLVEHVEEVIVAQMSQVSQNLQDDVVLDRKYIKGTISYNNSALIWVDIDRLLTAKEHELMKNVSHAKRAG